MGLFTGKSGLVFGIANDYSIAWAITKALHAEGAEMGFTHLPDEPDRPPRMRNRLLKLVEPLGAKLAVPCDVQNDGDLDQVFAQAQETFGGLDFVVHSIAYAPVEDLKGPTYTVSRHGFGVAMDVSVYSLIAVARRALPLMRPGGTIITLTYLGGEGVIPGYNLMGVCKSALDSTVKYLASELGPQGVRVNGISAGPIKTLASSAVGDFQHVLGLYTASAPLRRNVTGDEVARTALYLMSDMSAGVTGEIVHVDCGYHVMRAPAI